MDRGSRVGCGVIDNMAGIVLTLSPEGEHGGWIRIDDLVCLHVLLHGLVACALSPMS